MANKQRVHIIVSGRVQGVFFRDFTRQQANNLGITGWVKNLPDGKVQIVAEGEKSKLFQLIEAVKSGPERSNVKDCKIEWTDFKDEFTDFKIVY